MFRLTVFLDVSSIQLRNDLKGFGFNEKERGSLLLEMDSAYFKIRILSNQAGRQKGVGYHIYSNASIDAIIYFCDMIFPSYRPLITGLECELQEEHITPRLIRKIGGRMQQPNIYFIGDIGVVFLPNGLLNLQYRGKLGTSMKQTYECMKRIDQIRYKLKPNQIDLFSYLKAI
ncbi:hypothetical protein [Ornithinibacillus scapharcae]|uniref:hypothetical protein n=1 Tax=Ornithinibacillus scapharcae TaxID=1147159 RepID=UPI000225B26B|nr:hypothetical protein [Ornithinibacillus scapharcae]